ncbi:MAG: glycosyltransferase family 4 protein [Sphingomonadales bacterium]|nr:glycosyltransferase family 4 protein [Sphingomonadales bacterium]
MSQVPDSSSFLLATGARHGEVVPLFGGERPRRANAPLRVAVIGTYLPRKCGLATFTADVVEQLRAHHPEIAVDVYALDNPDQGLAYDGLAGVISAGEAADYARVARAINESGADVVWIQHEFGIFGGADGALVCDFVDRLAAPLVVTLHTVLTHPSDNQRAIIDHLVRRASQVMVMSRHGRELLLRHHHAPAGLVALIPHGAPDRPFGREAAFKRQLGLAERPVLMTFGLLGPGKGIDHMIEALPAIVARHPDVVYRVVGQVHPGLGAAGGSYRDSLHALADRLGVAGHVLWEERFLDTPELLDQLEACDIYVTPYLNLQQSTSGTLSYAVALGKAVVSTPYVHARELLAEDAGILVEPDSPDALSAAINRLLDDPALLVATKRQAYARGRETIWPEFAAASADLVRRAASPRLREAPLTATPGLTAVFAMSDGTGMLQHGIGPVPDRRHGYCLDDNARALMLMNVATGPAQELHSRALTYASFLQHAWNPDVRRFRNFMAFDRAWCEDIGSDDSNGRALWALGHTVEHQADPALRRWALGWFDTVAPVFSAMDYPRTLAFAMLGSAAVVRAMGPDAEWHAEARRILERGGDLLHRLLATSRRPDWTWFETMLGYDNPRLPQALIEAGQLLQRADWLDAGVESLAWIADRQRAAAGHFRPVGSETFGHDFDAYPFDQQPLEAQAAVEAAWSAFVATGDGRWRDHARTAWRWYFGGNDRGVCLADLASGRCRDGVTPRGANENCGAESILAFQLAYYTLVRIEGLGLNSAGPHHRGSQEGRNLESASRPDSHTATHP